MPPKRNKKGAERSTHLFGGLHMSRGRPTQGPALADKVEGSDQAKVRLKVILQTIAGNLSVADACKQLGLSEARFHELRQQWLQASCAALEPKPLGRPKETTIEEEVELLRLHRENQDLKKHLQAAQIREEIGVAMPHMLKPKEDSEKKS
jgi:transposase